MFSHSCSQKLLLMKGFNAVSLLAGTCGSSAAAMCSYSALSGRLTACQRESDVLTLLRATQDVETQGLGCDDQLGWISETPTPSCMLPVCGERLLTAVLTQLISLISRPLTRFAAFVFFFFKLKSHPDRRSL